jgi:AcrR family transcriptional regulator
MRTRPEDTRHAIAQAALATFCERGYGMATLEEIGAKAGLTRGGVLHHFKSKADLLGAVVAPYRKALADMQLNVQVDDPPSRSQRRELLTSFAELMFEHRGALRLLASDVSARARLGLGDRWPLPEGRLASLLLGTKATGRTQVQVAAALGAMIQPAAGVSFDLADAATRGELIDAAMAVMDGPPAITTHPGATSSRLGLVPLGKATAQ